MADLKPLIRFAKHTLDQKRLRLVDLQRQADRLHETIAADRAALLAERALAAADGEAALALAGYAHAVEARRRQALTAIARLEKEIARAKDIVMEAFRETKRYETAQAAREAAAAKTRARAEQTFLDEAGLEGFRRGQS
jgi:flagellar export protein FliJ